MGVYVDSLMPCPTNPKWRWKHSCHLMADTVDELDAFAIRLGLKRNWRQDHKRAGLTHYDLTPNMRKKALAAGASEITVSEMVKRGMGRRTSRGGAAAALPVS